MVDQARGVDWDEQRRASAIGSAANNGPGIVGLEGNFRDENLRGLA